MKRKNIIFVTLLGLLGLFAMQSCNKADDTTFTTKETFSVPAGSVTPAVRADGTVFFTGTTVELAWPAVNLGTETQTWDVYFGTSKSPGLYQSGVTTQSITVPVADGVKYWWFVESVDARGIVTASPVFFFTAVNGTSQKFAVSLSCKTNIKTLLGWDLTADQVFNARLLILKKSDRSVIATVNDFKTSEVYRGFTTLPDGDYCVVFDIASKFTFGSYDVPVDLDLSLKFEQLGLINKTIDFPAVMTDQVVGSDYRAFLVDINKTGPVYTITKNLSFRYLDVIVPDQMVGIWKGTDATTRKSEVTTTLSPGKTIYIDNLNNRWMQDYWGEEIITHNPLKVVFDYPTGTLSIPSQLYMQTKYEGELQYPYYLKTTTNKGTSTFSYAGVYPVMTIFYTLVQNGTDIGANYTGAGVFKAVLTLDPAVTKVIKQEVELVSRPEKISRPVNR